MIQSLPYSFVEFNEPDLSCNQGLGDMSLPALDTFQIKFEIRISDDELIPITTDMFAGVCSTDCELIYDNNIKVWPVCNRNVLQAQDDTIITTEMFPVEVIGKETNGIPLGVYTLQQFIDALKLYWDNDISGLDFISCCEISVPVIDGCFVIKTVDEDELQLCNYTKYWGYGYVNFPAVSMDTYVGIGECFKYCILDADKNPIVCSNIFDRISKKEGCLTMSVRYYNEENAFGFKFTTYNDGLNDLFTELQIRIRAYLNKPTRPVEENIFRRSDNVQQRISTVMGKLWSGNTDRYTDHQHDQISVMFKHDVIMVTQPFQGFTDRRMTQIGEYSQIFPDITTYVSTPAEFKISDYQEIVVNNNCGFNCGIEIIDECEGGGTIVCPDKYYVEFEVGVSGMDDGDTQFQDNNLIGSTGVEVYREGIYQYPFGTNTATFNSVTGTVTFTPEVINGERIAIWQQ